MKATYSGTKKSDLKFEDLEPGDLFIIKPACGALDPEAVIVHMKAKSLDDSYNAIGISHGRLYNMRGTMSVIKVDGELTWKICS